MLSRMNCYSHTVGKTYNSLFKNAEDQEICARKMLNQDVLLAWLVPSRLSRTDPKPFRPASAVQAADGTPIPSQLGSNQGSLFASEGPAALAATVRILPGGLELHNTYRVDQRHFTSHRFSHSHVLGCRPHGWGGRRCTLQPNCQAHSSNRLR